MKKHRSIEGNQYIPKNSRFKQQKGTSLKEPINKKEINSLDKRSKIKREKGNLREKIIQQQKNQNKSEK
jgi:hypothetical protein